MAFSMMTLQDGDDVRFDGSFIERQYPWFMVHAGNSCTIQVDERSLEAAERVAQHLLEGVKRVRAYQALQAAQQPVAAEV